MSHRAPILFLSVLVSASIILTACTMDPEKSPAYSKLSTKLKALEDNQTRTQKSLENLYISLDTLDDDVKNLKGAAQTASASPEMKKDLATALQKVGQLEQQLKALSETAGSAKKESETAKAAAAKSVASTGKAAEDPAAAKAAAGKPGAGKSSAEKPAAGKSVAAKPAEGKPAAETSKAPAARASKAETKAKGFYYQVRQGDTLESIARTHKLSSADLCRANNLPLSAPLYPGQSIYVPQS